MSYMRGSLTVAPNGRVVIPAALRAELGVKDGGKLVARIENGALVLEPVESIVRRIQTNLRKSIPEGVSLVDELIAERRAEAARE